MTGPTMQTRAQGDGALRAGGVEYIVLGAAATSAELAVTVTVDPTALPRVRVARLK